MRCPRWAVIVISMVAGCGLIAPEPQLGPIEENPPDHSTPITEVRRPQQQPAPEPARDTSLCYFIEKPIASFAGEQEAIYREFEETQFPEVKDRNAHILAELWKERLLSNDIKDRLVDKHYRLVLIQFVGHYPAYHFVVRCHQTFPFPAVWMKFWRVISVNGKVALAFDRPGVTTSMSNNHMNVASLSGGDIGSHRIEPGDVVQYTIRLQEERDKVVVWQKTIPTNKTVVWPHKDSGVPPENHIGR